MSSESAGRPFKIPLMDLRPGRKLIAAAISLDVGPDLSGPELLSSALREFMKSGALVLGFACNTSEDRSLMTCTAIIDLTDAEISAEEVAGRLRASWPFREVLVFESPFEGFASVRGFLPEVADDRALLMTGRVLRGFFLQARESMGEAPGGAFNYYLGYFAGRALAGYYMQFGLERGIAAVVRAAEATGYASRVEFLADPGRKRYRIEAWRLVECESLSGLRKGKTSHFFRGVLAGFLSAAEGGEWDVEEVECINDGSDRCAFEARRRGA